MRKGSVFLLLATILQTVGPARAAESGGTFGAGYDGGPAGSMELSIGRFLQESSVELGLSVSWASRSPGDAAGARKIFINDAKNGTPEKSGSAWIYRLDIAHPLTEISGRLLSVFAGPRYSRYTAHFRYVGGNEEFDVRCNQYGLGGGLRASLPLGDRSALLIRGGADYYLESSLQGHDTRYDPNGEDVNPRGEYGYADADAAIDQPRVIGRFIVAIRVRFGR